MSELEKELGVELQELGTENKPRLSTLLESFMKKDSQSLFLDTGIKLSAKKLREQKKKFYKVFLIF